MVATHSCQSSPLRYVQCRSTFNLHMAKPLELPTCIYQHTQQPPKPRWLIWHSALDGYKPFSPLTAYWPVLILSTNRHTDWSKNSTWLTKLSAEPNGPSDDDRKDKWDTENRGKSEADASVIDRHGESSKLLKFLPPAASVCPTNLGVLQRSNIVNVRNGLLFLPSVSIMDIPVKSICTNHSLVSGNPNLIFQCWNHCSGAPKTRQKSEERIS